MLLCVFHGVILTAILLSSVQKHAKTQLEHTGHADKSLLFKAMRIWQFMQAVSVVLILQDRA